MKRILKNELLIQSAYYVTDCDRQQLRVSFVLTIAK